MEKFNVVSSRSILGEFQGVFLHVCINYLMCVKEVLIFFCC